MAVRIQNLICRVNVRTKTPYGVLHQDVKPPRPTLAYARVTVAPPMETGPAPSETATQPTDAARQRKRRIAPGMADARAVAERVYDIMKEEARLTRLRGKPW